MNITDLNVDFYNLQCELRKFSSRQLPTLNTVLASLNALMQDLINEYSYDVVQAPASDYAELNNSMYAFAELLCSIYDAHQAKLRALCDETFPENFLAVKKEILETKTRLLEQEGQLEKLKKAKAELEASLAEEKRNLKTLQEQQSLIASLTRDLNQTIEHIRAIDLPGLEQQKSDLEAQKSQLQQKQADLTDAIQKTQAAITHTQQDCCSKDDECTRLSGELEQCRAKLASALARQKELEEQQTKVQEAESSADTRSRDLNSQITKSREHLAALEGQISDQTEQLQTIAADTTRCRAEHEALLLKLDSAQNALAGEQQKVSTVQDAINKTNSGIAQCRQDLAAKQQQHSDLLADLNDLHNKAAAEDAAIAQLNRDIPAAKKILADKAAEQDALQDALDQLRSQIRDCTNAIADLNQARKDLEDRLDILKEEKCRTGQQLAELKDQLAELTAALEDAHQQVALLNDNICRDTASLDECRAKIDKLRNAYANVHAALTAAQAEEACLSAAVQAAQFKKQELDQKIAAHKQVLQDLANVETDILSAEAALTESRTKLANAATRRDDLRQQIQTATEAAESLRLEADQLEVQAQNAEAQRLQQESVRDDLRNTVAQAQAQTAVLKQQSEDLQTELEQTDKDAQSFRQRIAQLNTDIADAKKIYAELCKEIRKQEEELAYQTDLIASKRTLLTNTAAECTDLKEQAGALDAQLSELRTQRTSLEDQIGQIGDKTELYTEKVAENQAKLDRQSQHYDELAYQLDEINRKITLKIEDLKPLRKKIEEAEKDYRVLDPVATRAKYELQLEEIKEQTESVKKMKAKNEENAKQLDDLRDQYREERDRQANVKAQFQDLEGKLSVLRDPQTAAAVDLLRARIQLMEQICDKLYKEAGSLAPEDKASFNLKDTVDQELQFARSTMNTLRESISKYLNELTCRIPCDL